MSKIIYEERCIVEALSKQGRKFSREISLVAEEITRESAGELKLIKIKVIFKNGKKQEKETFLISDLKVVRDYFLRKISAAIDLVPPEKRIKITFPPQNKYLKMRRAYCRHCGKFLKEFYGFYEGREEKCPSCGRLTGFERSAKGK